MFNYRMRARSVTGGEYTFGLNDCPVIIDDERFILFNTINTPILLYNTVVCETKHDNLFDGDIIKWKDKPFVISPLGFEYMAICKEETVALSELSNYEVLGNIYDGVYVKARRPVFLYRGTRFVLNDILGIFNKAIHTKFCRISDIGEVQQITPQVTDKPLFYGDFYQDGILTLENGKIKTI